MDYKNINKNSHQHAKTLQKMRIIRTTDLISLFTIEKHSNMQVIAISKTQEVNLHGHRSSACCCLTSELFPEQLSTNQMPDSGPLLNSRMYNLSAQIQHTQLLLLFWFLFKKPIFSKLIQPRPGPKKSQKWTSKNCQSSTLYVRTG